MVGGAVRNALLGEPIGDIDVATTAVPEEVIRRATAAGFKPVPTGIEHGTVTVVIDGQPFEVTTLREDVETFGRHANVRFGRDWRADAERRDFTMNALFGRRPTASCTTMSAGSPISRRGACASSARPATRIAEDYLRILRFFRFHAAYGHGAPDAAGLARLHRRARRPRAIVARARADGTAQASGRAARDADARGHGGVRPAAAGARRRARSRGFRQHGQGRGRGRRAGRSGAPARRARACGSPRMPSGCGSGCGSPMPSTSGSPRWATAGGGCRRHDEQAARALLYRLGPERFVDRVLIAWARSAARRARRSLARAGDACRSAGRCRCSRSRPPISSSAACREGAGARRRDARGRGGLDRGGFSIRCGGDRRDRGLGCRIHPADVACRK